MDRMAPKLKWDIGGEADWKRIYSKYDHIFEKKAETKTNENKRKELIELDKWYQETLPVEILARSEKFITHEELKKLTKWKVTKGKFRPTLQKLVGENTSDSVEESSKKAFKQAPKDVGTAIKTLSTLRGVGPATASAILAAGVPDLAPFMSDEAVLASGITNLKYDLKCYIEYYNVVCQWSKTLKKDNPEFGWSPHKVEIVLWTYYMAQSLDPGCLVNDSSNVTSKGKKRKSGPSEDDHSKKASKK